MAEKLESTPEEPLVFNGGAVRSGALPYYRLVPHSFKRVVAEALTEGSVNYEHLNGRPTPLTSNWRRGDLKFFLASVDHLDNHVSAFEDKLLEFGLDASFIKPDEVKKALLQELGHAAANIAFLVEWIDTDAMFLMVDQELSDLAELEFPTPAVADVAELTQTANDEADKIVNRAPAFPEEPTKSAIKLLTDGIWEKFLPSKAVPSQGVVPRDA